MDKDRAVQLVREDLMVGLHHSFSSRNEPEILDNGLVSDTHAAVQWSWDCSHTGLFQGLKTRGVALTIRGVTIVDDEKGEPVFQRYVDWSEVMQQLGMYASFRPTIETDGAAEKGLEDEEGG